MTEHQITREGIMLTGNAIAVIGPSGSGKSSLIRPFLEQQGDSRLFHFSVSSTTRPIRDGEVHGTHYHFITTEEFEAKIQAGHFFEWAKVHENHYGTEIKHVLKMLQNGVNVILDIDPQGLRQMRKHRIFAASPERLHSIFIDPGGIGAIRERLSKRGEPQESLDIRIANAEQEMLCRDECNHVISNADGQLHHAQGKFAQVILYDILKREC